MSQAMPPEAFAGFAPRIKGYGNGAGSVFFFEDTKAWDKLKEDQPMAAPLAGEWADVVSGGVQITSMYHRCKASSANLWRKVI